MSATKPRSCRVAGLRTVPEIPEPIELPVTGTLPAYLAHSTLYRNGPGRYEATHADGKPYNIRHWFDGFALVHAFAIDAEANRVRYRNRFVSAAVTRAIEAKKKSKYGEFTFGSDDPCRAVLGKFFQLLTSSPAVDPISGEVQANCNVTLQHVPGKGKLVARTDTSENIVLDEETLEVDHFFRFSKLNAELCGPFSSAHAYVDRETGDFINFNYDLKGPGPVKYNVFRIKKDGEVEILASFRDLPVYIHSFATTPNYVVMCLWPLQLDALKLLINKSVTAGMHFESKLPTKFVVISRHERRVVATYESPSFFCFHTINAFEQDGNIHIDLCKYKDDRIVRDLALENMSTGDRIAPSCLSRFTLESVSTCTAKEKPGAARETVLNEEDIELPRIHPTLRGKSYRFVYGVGDSAAVEGGFMNTICKVDVTTGDRVEWVSEGVVGEPIFVPDPEGKNEDDGALLVVVLDGVKQMSDMVVLDARSMTEVARASVPQAVPLGFHGKFDYV